MRLLLSDIGFGPAQGLKNFKWRFAINGHCCTLTEGMESFSPLCMDTECLISESAFFIMIITLS
jgi:hypothetical protein